MTTVGELKKLISDLPDDAEVLVRAWRYTDDGRTELWGHATEPQVETLIPVADSTRFLRLSEMEVDEEFKGEADALAEFEEAADTYVVLWPNFEPKEARDFYNG